jgi:uncharacterized surface protein with fasciclin (FAS1) repeats
LLINQKEETMFNFKKSLILLVAVASISLMPTSFAGHHAKDGHAKATPNIIGLAASSKELTTLVTAVKAAKLVSTLSSTGPFTVFAPNNAAFDKLPEGTVASLLKPENKDTLTSILTYHVVSGEVKASALIDAISENNGEFFIPTVNGGTLTAKIVEGDVYLTDAKGGMSKIIATDLNANNGVVHLINTVVMP